MSHAKRSWLALLPASKGTADGGDGPPWGEASSPDAAAVTAALTEVAAAADDAALCKLTEARASQADAVRALVAALPGAPTLAAWRRYTGVVHGAADPGSLTGADRQRFRRHVGYVSALAGLVLADEPLPAYRLPMAARLGDLGGLAAWWRPRIAARLDDVVAPGGRLWLLTGGEYERAIDPPDTIRPVTVTFVEQRRGKDASPPAAAVKQARGLLARTLATSPGLARRPDAEGWADLSFLAGGRTLTLDDADADRQTWRAEPAG